MSKRAVLALLLTVGVGTPAWAQEVECETRNVFAFSSNRHDLTSTPPINTVDIYTMDVDTNGIPLYIGRRLRGTDGDYSPAWSPDGKGRIVFDSNRNRRLPDPRVPGDLGDPVNTSHLFLMRADGSHQRLLTQGSSATWSPSGRRIAFHASEKGTGIPINSNPGAPTEDSVLFVARVGDRLEGRPKQITQPDDGTVPGRPAQVDDDADWSPVADQIVFIRKNRTSLDQNNPTAAQVWVVNADGTSPEQLTDTDYEERSPAWSPDGERIAYSCRTGIQGGNTLEICVMNVADRTVKKLTDNNLADLSPHWSPDGKKILFQRAPPVMGQGQQLWVMNAGTNADGSDADGTGQTRITGPPVPGFTMHPTWGEIKGKCDDEDDEDDDNDDD